MTLKQQLFVQAYIANGGNATEAACAAGYKGNNRTLRVTAARTLTNANVAEAIKALTGDLAEKRGILPADGVLSLLTEQATANLGDFIELRRDADGTEAWQFSIAKAKRLQKLHLLKSIKAGKDGTKFEMYDAQAAAVQLGKFHGLFTDTIVVKEQAAEWASGFVQDAIGVLREFITDTDQLETALDALQSRLAARVRGGGAGSLSGSDHGAAVPDAALVG